MVPGERGRRQIVVEGIEGRVRHVLGTVVGILLLVLATGVWARLWVPPLP